MMSVTLSVLIVFTLSLVSECHDGQTASQLYHYVRDHAELAKNIILIPASISPHDNLVVLVRHSQKCLQTSARNKHSVLRGSMS